MAELIGFDTHLGNCVSNIQMSPQVTKKIRPVYCNTLTNIYMGLQMKDKKKFDSS
jgi:hypothetical protein